MGEDVGAIAQVASMAGPDSAVVRCDFLGAQRNKRTFVCASCDTILHQELKTEKTFITTKEMQGE